ncbi:MAG: hypothetical protein ACREMS_02765 [Gemmatimonadaceae bacterium]
MESAYEDTLALLPCHIYLNSPARPSVRAVEERFSRDTFSRRLLADSAGAVRVEMG